MICAFDYLVNLSLDDIIYHPYFTFDNEKWGTFRFCCDWLYINSKYISLLAFVNLPHSHESACTENGVHCKHYTLGDACIDRDLGHKIWLDFIN
jgi:hypothetical protein